MSSLLTVFLVLACCRIQQVYSDDVSIGTEPPAPPNKRYQVTDYGKLTCMAPGFTCRYIETEFENITLTRGVSSNLALENDITYTIWSIDEADATSFGLPLTDVAVTLQDCTAAMASAGENGTLSLSSCIADCTFGCNCTLSDGAECLTVGTAAPTVAPATTAPNTGGGGTSNVCLVQNQTGLCYQLYDAVPDGNIDLYGCFNFCGGEFAGACDFGQDCPEAAYSCEDPSTAGEQGTSTGVVSGCTKEQLLQVPGSGGVPTAGFGRGSILSNLASFGTFCAGVTAWLFL